MASGGAAAASVRASESERGGVEEREWHRREKQARPGAPGGRPGHVHPAACAPCGGRAQPARNGGTARLPFARGRGRGHREGEGVLVG